MSLPSTYNGNYTESEESTIVYNYDWSKTSLGPMDSWDPIIKNAVNLCLQSVFPIGLFLGPDWIVIYNKAFRPMIIEKNPLVIGKSIKGTVSVSDYLISLFENVRTTGKGIFQNDQFFELQCDGYKTEMYYSYTFSPILKSDGTFFGIICLAQNTAQRVVNARRLKTISDFGHWTSEIDSLESACSIMKKILKDNNVDIPYALVYFVEHKLNISSEYLTAHLKATTFDEDDKKERQFPDYFPETHEIIDLSKDVDKNYGTYVELNRGSTTYSFLTCKSWPIHLLMKEGGHVKVLLKDESQAVLLLTKIPFGDGRALSVIFIYGINRLCVLDEQYMEFLQLVTNQMNSFLSHGRSIEEEKMRSKILADLNHQKVTFFQGISHQLKTPLTLMFSPLDDVINASSPEEPIMSYLQTIRRLDKGADDYLIKPFSTQELITRIRVNIELSLLRHKIIFQQCKEEETKQLLISISTKMFSGLSMKETLQYAVEEIYNRLPCKRIFITSNEQLGFKSNKIIALYENSENSSMEICDDEIKSQTFMNSQEVLKNNLGIEVYSDVYSDDVCENVSILSAELRLNNNLWGWMKLYRSPNSIWLDSEIEFLQQISNQICLTITYISILEENIAKEIQIKAAEVASITKSQILANTSHELRTPLGAIIGILSSLDDTNLTSDQENMIKIMTRSSDVVLSIVNDILDAQKLEAQKLTLVNRTFDLLELFDNTIDMFGEKTSAKKIELIIDYDVDELPKYVKSDPERLKQILSHLLSNS
ncbi:protein-histidine kinase [Gigaspora margarita]|nr:protein-histidine kinase [Gigaspora margarita]